MLFYGREWKLVVLQSKEPYSVTFRSHNKSDQFTIQVQEDDLYSMNETRADCYTHQASSNNEPEDMKIYLLLGYHNNALAPLVFQTQGDKWGHFLRWRKHQGWIIPMEPTKQHRRSDQGDDSVKSNKRMRTSSPCHVDFSNDEWAFVMSVLTGKAITPRSFADIDGPHIYNPCENSSFSSPSMPDIPLLTSANCFIVVLHSMQMGLMHRMLKDWEGRNSKISRKWVVFASCVQDSKIEDWVTDASIKRGHIYCVAYVKEIVPGRERRYDWKLTVYPLREAVPIPAVGLGHVKPTPAHASAMLALNAQLASLQMPARAKSVWTHFTEPTEFTSTVGNARLPLRAVEQYGSRQHTSWPAPAKTGDVVWYSPVVKSHALSMVLQVRVLGQLCIMLDAVCLFVYFLVLSPCADYKLCM
jgi:hypothetical protein